MKRIAAILLIISAVALFADIPQMVNYQGKLTDPDGVAYEGILTVTFTIYDAETGGTALWTENQDVEITRGLFDVQLGTFSPLTEEVFTGERYLEISVGAESLSPRQLFTSVPYAYRSAIAESLVGGSASGNNLDEAYDESPSGDKRIDADDGAVIVESGAGNGAISAISGSSADAALYANNTAGGNAIWADENIFANDADIVAKGNIEVEDGAGTRTAGMVGSSGNFWLHGRIDMKNDKSIFAENTSGTPMAIFTPLNFENNVVLSMADGNNFYVQDNTYTNIAQFSGGSTSLYLYGDLSMDSPSGTGDYDILMNDNSIWDADYIETNYIQDGEDSWVDVLDNLDVNGDISLTGSSRVIDFVDGAGDLTSPTGMDIIIDDDADASSSEFRVRHDAVSNLFRVSEAQYIAIEPRTSEPSGAPDGGIYVNGNATGTDSLFFYDGTGWAALATTGMLGGSYIENQYATEQFANFYMGGKGHIHNTVDNDTAFIATQGGANTIGIYARGGSSAGSVALVAERPTENNRAELANADYGVYGEVNANDEVGVYGINPATSGTATGIKGEAIGAGGTTHIGVHGIATGATNNYGGYFEGDLLTTGTLEIGDVPNDASPDSVLTLVDGVVYRADASAFATDADWQVSGSDMHSIPTGNVGIGTTTPSSKLTAVQNLGGTDGIVLEVDASGGSGMTYPNIYGVHSDVNMTSNGGGFGVYGRGHSGSAAVVATGVWGSAYSTSVSSNLKGVIGQIETGSAPDASAAIYGVVGDVGIAFNGPWSGYFTGAPVSMPGMSSPSATDEGAVYYDTDDDVMYYYNGTSWISMGGTDADWVIGTGVVYNTTDNIGIGTSTPAYALDVVGDLRVDSPTFPGRDYRISCGSRQQIYATNDLVEFVDHNKCVVTGADASGGTDQFQVSGVTEGNKLFVVDGNDERVGVKTISPQYDLDVRDRLGVYNGTNFIDLNPAASQIRFNEADVLHISSGSGYGGIESSGECITIDGTTRNVGIGTTNPLARLALDGDGAAHQGMFIEGPSTNVDGQAALYIHSNPFSSDPPDTYNKYYGIYVNQEPATSPVYHPTAIFGNMSNVTDAYSTGVLGRSIGTGSDGGRTYGVKGYAGGGSSHYNYAIYGQLDSVGVPARQGTAILGYDAIDHSGFDGSLLDGNWAGYFHGNVLITDSTCFGGSDVYIYRDGSSNMVFRDPNANSGSEITLTDLYSGGDFIENRGFDDGLQSNAGWRISMPPPPDEATSVTDTITMISCQTTSWPSDNALYNLVSTIDTVSDGAGTALYGRLDVDFSTFTGRASFRGASGHSYSASGGVRGARGDISASKLETNYSNYDVIGVGIAGKATGETLTPDAVAGTDRLVFAGVTGEIDGEINTPPTMPDTFRCTGVWGVDNNSGTAQSFAGYFDGDVFATGNIESGIRVLRGECQTNDVQIRYRNTSGGAWDYQEEKLINYGRSTSLAAGYWDYAAYRHARTLIKFDLTEIPSNATIVSADIMLYCSNVNGSGSYSLYKMRRHWDEGDFYCGKGVPSTYGECDSTDITGGCCWEYYSGTNAWGTAGADNTTTDRYSTAETSVTVSSTGWKTWDVISAIQDIVDGTTENYGFIIIGPSSGMNNASFKSSECAEFELKPKLEIEWIY